MDPSNEVALLVFDTHNRVDAVEQLIESNEKDVTILLGDYFDERGDGPGDAEKTARWLARSLRKRDRVHLIGNHDIPYLFPCRGNPFHHCPGWTEEKHAVVQKILRGVDLSGLRLAHSVQGWLCSHAGLTPNALPQSFLYEFEVFNEDVLAEYINRQLGPLRNGGAPDWILYPGKRLGRPYPGGILWCDWENLAPIPGIKQIVGHSGRTTARLRIADGGVAACLDGHGLFVGRLVGGELEVGVSSVAMPPPRIVVPDSEES